jgi:hypothetical protein
MGKTSAILLAFSLTVTGCSSGGIETEDGGVDAGTEDAGVDGGTQDAGSDAGPQDAGVDAGPQDAGVDAGQQDAGVDAGPDDGGVDGGTGDGDSENPYGLPIIFQSGFEPDTTISADLRDISGIDHSVPPPNDWVQSFRQHPNRGNAGFYYENGTYDDRRAAIIDDPTNPGNQALHFYLHRPADKGRVQMDHHYDTGLVESYHLVDMYIHPDFNLLKTYQPSFTWMTIAEFWNNHNNDPAGHPFRITVSLVKLATGNVDEFHWWCEGQRFEGPYWEEPAFWIDENLDFPVPIGEWFRISYYFKEGDNNTGRFVVEVTTNSGEHITICDVHNYTHEPDNNSPDGLGHIDSLKIYTDGDRVDFVRNQGGTLQLYWDNFRMYGL